MSDPRRSRTRFPHTRQQVPAVCRQWGAADGDWPCRRERAEKESLRAVNDTGQKGFAMNRDLVQLSRFRRTSRHTESRTDLTTCSLCLRCSAVTNGSMQSVLSGRFAPTSSTPPRLHDAVCEAWPTRSLAAGWKTSRSRRDRCLLTRKAPHAEGRAPHRVGPRPARRIRHRTRGKRLAVRARAHTHLRGADPCSGSAAASKLQAS